MSPLGCTFERRVIARVERDTVCGSVRRYAPRMTRASHAAAPAPRERVTGSLLRFWIGYVAITLAVGFVTTMTIGSEVAQLAAWGFVSAAALLFLPRLLARTEPSAGAVLRSAARPRNLGRFALGLAIGGASFGVHVLVITTFAGPVRFEPERDVGALMIALYFLRFLATSCMEEVGFRGFPLRRLTRAVGVWPAVLVTAVLFGLSHLLYGWDLRTIALGVVPPGILWGMSAVATRGLAVPIGLHAAWNFAGWTAGSRAEVGPLRMVIADDALERSRAVGTVSYAVVFGVLTLAFWVMHRRRAAGERVVGG